MPLTTCETHDPTATREQWASARFAMGTARLAAFYSPWAMPRTHAPSTPMPPKLGTPSAALFFSSSSLLLSQTALHRVLVFAASGQRAKTDLRTGGRGPSMTSCAKSASMDGPRPPGSSKVAVIKKFRRGARPRGDEELHAPTVRVDGRRGWCGVVEARSDPAALQVPKSWSFPPRRQLHVSRVVQKGPGGSASAEGLREERLGRGRAPARNAVLGRRAYFEDAVLSSMIPRGKRGAGGSSQTSILHESTHSTFFVRHQVRR